MNKATAQTLIVIACITAATVCNIAKLGGWGWFLLIAFFALCG